MQINDNVLQNNERILFRLRELYLNSDFQPYRMSKFEEYDLYAKNKDFLVSDNVITFTDTNGKLMALKPDVTLSIIKNTEDNPDMTQKVFYNENVYRVSKGTNTYKEILQAGVECFGKVNENEICEVITLAVKSLSLISDFPVLNISYMDIMEELLSPLDLSSKEKKECYKAISEKNVHELENILANNEYKENLSMLSELIEIDDKLVIAKEKLNDIFRKYNKKLPSSLEKIIDLLSESDVKEYIKLDFSVSQDVNYYNGIVFKGYIKEVPLAVLSGGQYDRLLNKLKRKSKAVGFAIYTDALERINETDNDTSDGYVNIALPKGRLGEKVYNWFKEAGFDCDDIFEENRKLVFENKEKKIRYFLVKPSDVAIYVERGAADIGAVGKDILLEYEPDVYELYDLNLGKCFMAVAGPVEKDDDKSKTLIVATKFSNIAQKYYRSLGRDIDIIHLNGSIELAPILRMSDVIVDIVETGTTLKENNMEVKTRILPVSTRLIANKSSYKFKNTEINELVNRLKEKEQKND